MSSGNSEFDLEGDSTQLVRAFKTAQQELSEFEKQIKKFESASTKATEESIKGYQDLLKGATEYRQIVALLETDIKKLSQVQKEASASGGGPKLIDESFLQAAKEVEDIRQQRMQKEGQEKAQQENEIRRITQIAKESIQAEIDSNEHKFYEWERGLQQVMTSEEVRHREQMEQINREMMVQRRQADEWIAGVRTMQAADEARTKEEEEQISTIAREAKAALEAEAEAELMRHVMAMNDRKEERLIIESLALLSKDQAQTLKMQGAVDKTTVDAASKMRVEIEQTAGSFGKARSEGGRYREIMTQLTYAAGDFMSVQGDMADRIRAVANNFQYMAMSIGGAWGVAINALTLIVQAGSQVAKSMSKTTEATEGSTAAYKDNAAAITGLRDEIEKTTLSEEALARVQMARKINEDMVKAKKQFEEEQKAAQDMKASTYEGAVDTIHQKEARGEGLTFMDRVNPMLAFAAKGFRQGGADERIQQQAAVRLESAQAEFANTARMSREAMSNFDRDQMVKQGEKFLGGGKAGLQKVYETEQDTIGMPAAIKHLEELIRAELPEKMKGAAGELANKIAREGAADISGKRLAAKFAGKLPSEEAAEDAKKDLEEARMKVEQAKFDANKDRFESPQEKAVIKGLENLVRALDMTYKNLEEKAKAEKDAAEKRLIQGPAPQRPPPINRNGNL